MAIDPKDLDDEEIDEVKTEDAGLDDDEGGDEAQAGQESPDEEAEEGLSEEKPSRATRAVLEAKRAAKEATERTAALEREIQALRAERAQAAQPKEETAEQEMVKLQLMTVEERVEYKLEKALKVERQQRELDRFRSADMNDRAQYNAKAATDPRRKKYEAEVEATLQLERRQGRDFPRDTIYYFLLGQKVANGGAAKAKSAAQGQERIRSQQARADSGRGDRAAPRRNADDGSLRALEKRLEGQFL